MFFQVFLISLLAGMSPGPDFVLVMKNSLGHGRSIGIASAFGIAAALAVHATYTVLGIAFVIQRHSLVYAGIQFSGAAYLAYLGAGAILSTLKGEKAGIVSVSSGEARKTPLEGFVNGFLCNILNPKAFVFFLSIFSQFIVPGMPKWMELIYGAEVVATIGAWFVLVSVLISLEGFRTAYAKSYAWLDRAFGTILLFFALKVFRTALG